MTVLRYQNIRHCPTVPWRVWLWPGLQMTKHSMSLLIVRLYYCCQPIAALFFAYCFHFFLLDFFFLFCALIVLCFNLHFDFSCLWVGFLFNILAFCLICYLFVSFSAILSHTYFCFCFTIYSFLSCFKTDEVYWITVFLNYWSSALSKIFTT